MDEFQFAWEASRVCEQGQLQQHFDPVLLAKAVWSASHGKIATYTQSSLGRSKMVVAINNGRLIIISVGEGVTDDMQTYITSLVKILDVKCPVIRYQYESGVYRKIKGLWI